MVTHRAAQAKAESLCWLGIREACEVLLQEGGAPEVLKFLATLTRGEVIPASVVLTLQQQAAEIAHGQNVHSA
jgi:hypothetical protein